ncbi:MAG: GNAT family N-acetyltransferase, partial [Caulobacteraceae bacterium]
LIPICRVWVTRAERCIVGFLALRADSIEQLHVLPRFQRQGLGTALLAKARTASPDRLTLFTFQANTRARAFYERHGFRAVDFNDGERNEEKTPDVRYEWSAPEARLTP